VARRRFGVALLLPRDAAAELDTLRRACGADDIDRIPPHVTLVPPVNVPIAAVDACFDVVTRAAAVARPLDLELGPVATFSPTNPVAYASVHGDLDALSSLRAAVFVEPLHREVTYGFVPHATIVVGADGERLDAIVTALSNLRLAVRIDRVHVLEERRDDDGVSRWRPIADAPLGASGAKRGTGGIAVMTQEADRWPSDAVRSFSVRASMDGRTVGTAHGRVDGDVAWLDRIQVDEHARGLGVARHLHAEVLLAAARRGAVRIEARGHPFLVHHGWGPPGFSPIMQRVTQ
jgi:2'-5' RNA ligase